MRLSLETYMLNAEQLAPKLLGMKLCRSHNGKISKYKITETECYFGESDTACHAHKGKTARTKIMYEQGGLAYVYLCYGIHYMLNIVTGQKDIPQAVLIRGIEGFDGPGKLTKALAIDKTLNGENLLTSNKLWIENKGKFDVKYIATKRIGIAYASKEDQDRLWRFKITD